MIIKLLLGFQVQVYYTHGQIICINAIAAAIHFKAIVIYTTPNMQ